VVLTCTEALRNKENNIKTREKRYVYGLALCGGCNQSRNMIES